LSWDVKFVVIDLRIRGFVGHEIAAAYCNRRMSFVVVVLMFINFSVANSVQPNLVVR